MVWLYTVDKDAMLGATTRSPYPTDATDKDEDVVDDGHAERRCGGPADELHVHQR